jgi:hypothetical protein
VSHLDAKFDELGKPQASSLNYDCFGPNAPKEIDFLSWRIGRLKCHPIICKNQMKETNVSKG